MMDFKQELAQFRQSMDEYRKEIKASVSGDQPVEDEKPKSIWADEVQMPDMGPGMPLPEQFSGEVEVPNVLTDFDARFTGDEAADKQAFQEFMMNDPMVQQYGPQMEALLDEVMAQASDPDNPMTQEEAQQLFIEMMTEQFGQHFQ